MYPKIFLAATSHVKSPIVGILQPHYILESYMDLKSDTKVTQSYIQWCLSGEEFLLDSGAFTFMNKKIKETSKTEEEILTDLEPYIQGYINFINKYDIKLFFELDIDCMISYDKVKEIRKNIESQTNKKCIPVWHKSRGKEEFIKMCDEYEYVAIGGIASREIKKKEWPLLWELCDIAHSKNCKVHGLGFLPLDVLNNGECPFDTVDGTSWQGHMRKKNFLLEGKTIKKIDDTRYWKEVAYDCFKNWTEYSRIIKQ